MAALNVSDNDLTLFLDSLTYVLQDETICVGYHRNRKVLKDGTSLQENLLQMETVSDPVWEHIHAIVGAVKKAQRTDASSNSANRWKKLVEHFHYFWEKQLVELWEKLGDSLGLTFDAILVQSTTERLLLLVLEEASPTTQSLMQNLLTAVVQLCITIRGHTHAAGLVEKYKWAMSAQTKRSKGIRKSLKFND